MMNLEVNKATKIDSSLHEFYKLYSTDIHNVLSRIWKQEDIYGKSKGHYRLMQYRLAFTYATLIHLEYTLGINTEWEYYNAKYELKSYDRILRCNGIELSKVLALYNLPPSNDELGTEVENTLIVEELATTEEEADIVAMDILNLESNIVSFNDAAITCKISCSLVRCTCLNTDDTYPLITEAGTEDIISEDGVPLTWQ